MKKIFIILCAALVLSACNKGTDAPKSDAKKINLPDGVYTKESEKDEWGGYVKVSLTVKDGVITEASMDQLNKDGSIQDENYGKTDGEIKNPGLYKIAQEAIQNAEKYPQVLVEKGSLDEVEAISGATVSYNLFRDAVNKILEENK